MHTD